MLLVRDTPSNGTYDLRTGPEKIEERLRKIELLLYGAMPLLAAHRRLAELEDRVRQMERTIEQFTGDHR